MPPKKRVKVSNENPTKEQVKREESMNSSPTDELVPTEPEFNKMELCDTLSEILKVLVCPVCLDRLPSNIIGCVNGHAICAKCKRDMTKCPACRKSFLSAKPTVLCQVLEAFANPCRNEGCSVVEKRIENHERWCAFRMTDCKRCDWSGSVSKLLTHVQVRHGLASNKVNRTFTDFSVDTDSLWISGCVYHEQFFWRKIKVERSKNHFLLQFIWVPVKEVKDIFYVKVEFKSEDIEYVGKIKILPGSDGNCLRENSLSFDCNVVKQFVDQSNTLKYNIYVTKNGVL